MGTRPMPRSKTIPTYPDRVLDFDENVAIEGQRFNGVALTARTIFAGREYEAHALIHGDALLHQDPAKLRAQAELDLDVELRRLTLGI